MTHTSDPRGAGRGDGPRTHARLCSALAALLVWGALPGVGRAQTPDQTPASPVEPTMVQEPKSPVVAFGFPIAVTAFSVGMFASRDDSIAATGALLFVAGPSAGHVYTGESRKALLHIGVRTVAAAVSTAGILGLFFDEDCNLLERDDTCDLRSVPGLLMIGGVVVGTASAAYSIIDAPYAAHRYNRKASARQILITPAPMVGPDHSAGLGLQLGGRF
jgi:hypothetical protein